MLVLSTCSSYKLLFRINIQWFQANPVIGNFRTIILRNPGFYQVPTWLWQSIGSGYSEQVRYHLEQTIVVVGAGEKFNLGKSNCVTDSLSPDHPQQEPNCIATLIALVQQVPSASERKLTLMSYKVFFVIAHAYRTSVIPVILIQIPYSLDIPCHRHFSNVWWMFILYNIVHVDCWSALKTHLC